MDNLPPWSLIQGMLTSLILPTAVVALLLALAAAWRGGAEKWRTCLLSTALLAALAWGNHTAALLQWWPVEQGWAGLLAATLLVVVASLFIHQLATEQHQQTAKITRLLVVCGAGAWLSETFPPLSRWHVAIILGLGLLLVSQALDGMYQRYAWRGFLVAMVAPWGGACAGVLIFGHSARFSDLAILMTTALCSLGVITAYFKFSVRELLLAPAVFFPALMLAGAANTYSNVPATTYALSGLAPVSLLVFLLPYWKRYSAKTVITLIFLTISTVSLAALVLAACAEDLEYGS